MLHVITRFAGGAGGNTLMSAAGMDPNRYESWITAASGGPLWEPAEAGGIETVRLPRLHEWISPHEDALVLAQLVRLIRRERFSIVHTHCSKGGLLGRLAASLAGTPAVVHTFHLFAAHDGLSPWRRAAYRSLDRLARPFADQYLAVSPRVSREAVETRLAPPGSVTVVPSAIEVDRIQHERDPEVRRELGISDAAQVVGWIGRMVPQKAPLDFVRMAAAVMRVRHDTVFVMVGDASFESAPLERETKAEARRLGVDIVFTGFRPDAPRLAAAFDVAVITSRYEGLGRALTEAMASGRPVVATAVNGVPDLVEPGSTGLLAPPGDTARLAECVLWLLDHPEEARRMGFQGRTRVGSSFDQATMCTMLDQIYSRLLGIPPSPGEVSNLSLVRPLVGSNGNGSPVPSQSQGVGTRAGGGA